MLDKNTLLEKFKRTQKTIKVKAWGGEVVIQQLSVKEKSEIEAIMYGDATPLQLREGTYEINMNAIIASRIKAVSLSLVEPQLSIEDLESLTGDASVGIIEVYKAIEDFNAPKK